MRTNPASTIGEIGAGIGVDATASASRVSEWSFAAARGVARARSSSAVALLALIGGRVSVSVMATAYSLPSASLPSGDRDCP